MKSIKSNFKATSIIEVMVVMLIVVSGVVGMFKVYGNSQKLASSTNYKIQAIQIAREGIEAVKNIRDTNWILYGADIENCWNVWNYQSTCVGNTDPSASSPDITADSYKLVRNSTNKWTLDAESIGTGLYSDTTYQTNYKVSLDANGFYTQSGAITDTKPLFTREIKIDYPEDTNGDTLSDSNDSKMRVTSLVQWVDGTSNTPHKVEFTTLLTNWKE